VTWRPGEAGSSCRVRSGPSTPGGREWVWQWVFPAGRVHRDANTGERRRITCIPTAVQRAFREAVAGQRDRQTGIVPHIAALVRHASTGDGYDIRTVQELLGHRTCARTMMYTHVLNRGRLAVRSPADVL